jgi:DNA polymerase III delta prime subunit
MASAHSGQHLQALCGWLDGLLQEQVVRVRAERDNTPAEFRGLCITDREADVLLCDSSDVEPDSNPGEQSRAADSCREELDCLARFPDSRLTQLCARFGLTDFERRVLFIAAAPELDLRYQALYAYVQNDVTRKLPSIDLMLKLLCASREERWNRRAAFSPAGPLFRNLLLEFGDERPCRERPQLASSIVVPQRVVEFLLGHTSLDHALRDTAALIEPACGPEQLDLAAEELARLWRVAPLLESGGVVVLRGRNGIGKLRAARALCHDLRKSLIFCDFSDGAQDAADGALLRRECMLLDAALYLKVGAVTPENRKLHAGLTQHFRRPSFPVFLSMEDPKALAPDLRSPCFRFEFRLPDIAARGSLWQRELGEVASRPLPLPETEELAGEFRFTPGQIRAVAEEARSISLLRGADQALCADDIRGAARILCNAQLQSLSQRVQLIFDWDDLVLPSRVLQQLREIVSAVRLRHVVHTRWGFDAKAGKDGGINVLFSGVSGTGKTMSAAVLARSLGLDLYKIDLSSIVSKYVGETEQNLRRIFDEAEHSSAALFFDEADALFGKRSEVKDAQDRYANIEVAYLLQKMEQFSGLAILATNLSRNIDSAFLRRMQHALEFPFPDPAHRERIWRAMFPAAAPLGSDVDFPFLSRQFELSGGNIRNAVTTGAFLAAEREQPISMEHLVQAIGREMQKMGKLPSRADFQNHFEVISRQNSERP